MTATHDALSHDAPSHDAPSHDAPSHDAPTLIRLLNGLARKGAFVERTDNAFCLTMPGSGRRPRGEATRRFAPVVIEAAAQHGWIAGDGRHYRLTEAGALALHSGLKPVIPAASQELQAGQQVVPILSLPVGSARPARRAAPLPSHHMEAAERLAEDFQTGQMTPRVTSNWDRAALGALPDGGRNPSGRGETISERISAAQERVRRALTDAGPEFADVLIDLCCLETGVEAFETKRGWPRRSAKLVLSLALERLARHYGIVGRGPRHGQLQHHGTSDYRPA